MNFNQRIDSLTDEIDEEKKIRVTMQVEIDRLKRLVRLNGDHWMTLCVNAKERLTTPRSWRGHLYACLVQTTLPSPPQHSLTHTHTQPYTSISIHTRVPLCLSQPHSLFSLSLSLYLSPFLSLSLSHSLSISLSLLSLIIIGCILHNLLRASTLSLNLSPFLNLYLSLNLSISHYLSQNLS